MRLSPENPFILSIMKKGSGFMGRCAIPVDIIRILPGMSVGQLRFFCWLMELSLDQPSDIMQLTHRWYVWWLEERGFPKCTRENFHRFKREIGKLELIYPVEKKPGFYYFNVGAFLLHTQAQFLGKQVGSVMKQNAREIMDADKKIAPSVIVVDKDTGEVLNGEDDWGQDVG